MMDQGTEVKAGKVTKLCWLVCVIVIVVAVVISLLAVILYENQNQQGNVDITPWSRSMYHMKETTCLSRQYHQLGRYIGPSSNDCCEKSVEYQLAEDQATFLLQTRDLCTAICYTYFAHLGLDLETSETPVLVNHREVFRCLDCCQLLEEAECINLTVRGYENYCAWVDSGNSSACVGISLSPQPTLGPA